MEKEETVEPVERLKGNRLLPDGNKFVWGPISWIHEIGPYMIVEYRQDRSTFIGRDQNDHGRTLFHPYLNGKDTSTSYESLSSALVGVIGYEREGGNGRAACYFDLMTERRDG